MTARPPQQIPQQRPSRSSIQGLVTDETGRGLAGADVVLKAGTREVARTITSGDGATLPVTVSAGCAELGEAEPTGEQLLRTADVALFMAKRAGRNRVVAA